MRKSKEGLSKSQEKQRKKRKGQWRWIIFVSIGTLILSIVLSIISESLLSRAELLNALILLLIIIFIGVFFDMIGIAVASASETPFHAMAANKVYGAKQAVKLVKDAGQVSNFCNDVIGDICGIISGSTAAIIIYRISITNTALDTGIMSIVISGMVASLTVGGKAIGKIFALSKSNEIVYKLAIVIHWIKSSVFGME